MLAFLPRPTVVWMMCMFHHTLKRIICLHKDKVYTREILTYSNISHRLEQPFLSPTFACSYKGAPETEHLAWYLARHDLASSNLYQFNDRTRRLLCFVVIVLQCYKRARSHSYRGTGLNDKMAPWRVKPPCQTFKVSSCNKIRPSHS